MYVISLKYKICWVKHEVCITSRCDLCKKIQTDFCFVWIWNSSSWVRCITVSVIYYLALMVYTSYFCVCQCLLFFCFRGHVPICFPSTRKALWCHTALGSTLTLSLPRLNVSITEQVLYLAYGQSRSFKTEECLLCGSLKIEPDCSEVSLFVDQFLPENTSTQGEIVALRTQVWSSDWYSSSSTIFYSDVPIFYLSFNNFSCRKVLATMFLVI